MSPSALIVKLTHYSLPPPPPPLPHSPSLIPPLVSLSSPPPSPLFHRQTLLYCRFVLVLILVRYPLLLLTPYLDLPLQLLLFHGMCCTFYAGLKAFSQLHISTRHLRLVPGCPHNKFGQGLVERFHYYHRAHPWTFFKRHQATFH